MDINGSCDCAAASVVKRCVLVFTTRKGRRGLKVFPELLLSAYTPGQQAVRQLPNAHRHAFESV